MVQKNNSVDFSMQANCEHAEQLYEYLCLKAKTHNSYKFYARVERVDQIVHQHSLYLGNGVKWNDVKDRENFNSNSYDKISFGKCFSYSTDENVAMWMLYGGIYHTGAMVDFTRKGMNAVINAQNVELGYFNNNSFVSLKTIEKHDFDIDIVDVVYYNPQTGYLKRYDDNAILADKAIIDQLGACKKLYPWNYENECRLIVRIDKELVPKECTDVKIDISSMNLGKSLERAYYCPGYKGDMSYGFLNSKLDGSVDFELRDQLCIDCKQLHN